jgi:molybdenum cofactor biosynthesis protein B
VILGHQEHKREAPASVSCAVLTISDSRTEADDESGDLIKQKLGENGHRVMAYALLKNEAASLVKKLGELLGRDDIQVIITCGGTGLGSRDITVETILPFLEKKLDGFGELFRSLSYQEIGTASIMSRAVAGVARGRVILCLPGSLGAAKLAMESIILPEISHMVREATR